MRILLDENAPSGLRHILAGHDVRTAPEMGWARYSNGQLLDEAEKARFEALITRDRSLPYQQNLTGRNIAVIIFSTNAWPVIRTQPQTVQRAVANASPGAFTFANFRRPRRSPAPARSDLLIPAPPSGIRSLIRRTVPANSCAAMFDRARSRRATPRPLPLRPRPRLRSAPATAVTSTSP